MTSLEWHHYHSATVQHRKTEESNPQQKNSINIIPQSKVDFRVVIIIRTVEGSREDYYSSLAYERLDSELSTC